MQVDARLLVTQSIALFLALALALFAPAGTLAWPVGWLYLVLLFGFFLSVNAWLSRRDPGLLEERSRLSRADQKGWDKTPVRAPARTLPERPVHLTLLRARARARKVSCV
jgi:hypothetical protein